ncbi:MAG: hypothetical protein Q9219_005864 [cf. Caloplaca sp. 3 TL-2023]
MRGFYKRNGEHLAAFTCNRRHLKTIAVSVPLRLLAPHSDFCKRLAAGQETSTVERPEIDTPEIFEEFLLWIQHPLPRADDSSIRKIKDPVHCLDLFIIAQELQMPSLQQWAIWEYWKLTDRLPQDGSRISALVKFFFQLRPHSILRLGVANHLSIWSSKECSDQSKENLLYALHKKAPGFNWSKLYELLMEAEKHEAKLIAKISRDDYLKYIDQPYSIGQEGVIQVPGPATVTSESTAHVLPGTSNQNNEILAPGETGINSLAEPEAQGAAGIGDTNGNHNTHRAPLDVPVLGEGVSLHKIPSREILVPRLDVAAQGSAIDWTDPRSAIFAYKPDDGSLLRGFWTLKDWERNSQSRPWLQWKARPEYNTPAERIVDHAPMQLTTTNEIWKRSRMVGRWEGLLGAQSLAYWGPGNLTILVQDGWSGQWSPLVMSNVILSPSADDQLGGRGDGWKGSLNPSPFRNDRAFTSVAPVARMVADDEEIPHGSIVERNTTEPIPADSLIATETNNETEHALATGSTNLSQNESASEPFDLADYDRAWAAEFKSQCEAGAPPPTLQELESSVDDPTPNEFDAYINNQRLFQSNTFGTPQHDFLASTPEFLANHDQPPGFVSFEELEFDNYDASTDLAGVSSGVEPNLHSETPAEEAQYRGTLRGGKAPRLVSKMRRDYLAFKPSPLVQSERIPSSPNMGSEMGNGVCTGGTKDRIGLEDNSDSEPAIDSVETTPAIAHSRHQDLIQEASSANKTQSSMSTCGEMTRSVPDNTYQPSNRHVPFPINVQEPVIDFPRHEHSSVRTPGTPITPQSSKSTHKLSDSNGPASSQASLGFPKSGTGRPVVSNKHATSDLGTLRRSHAFDASRYGNGQHDHAPCLKSVDSVNEENAFSGGDVTLEDPTSRPGKSTTETKTVTPEPKPRKMKTAGEEQKMIEVEDPFEGFYSGDEVDDEGDEDFDVVDESDGEAEEEEEEREDAVGEFEGGGEATLTPSPEMGMKEAEGKGKWPVSKLAVKETAGEGEGVGGVLGGAGGAGGGGAGRGGGGDGGAGGSGEGGSGAEEGAGVEDGVRRNGNDWTLVVELKGGKRVARWAWGEF